MICHCPSDIRIKAILGVLPAFKVSACEQFVADGIPESQFERVRKSYGFDEFHYLLPPDTTADMMLPALREFFAREELDPASIDCLISLTLSPDYALPENSFVYHQKLSLSSKCICLDLPSPCTGFITALHTGCTLINSGSCKRVLLVMGDSCRLHNHYLYGQREILGGDAGAIVLLERDKEKERKSSTSYSALPHSFASDTLSQFNNQSFMISNSMRRPTASQLEDRALRVAPAEQRESYPDPTDEKLSIVAQKLGIMQSCFMALQCIVGELKTLLTANGLTLSDLSCGLMQHSQKLIVDNLNNALIGTCSKEAKLIKEQGTYDWLDLEDCAPDFSHLKSFFPFISREIGHCTAANIPVSLSLHQKEIPDLQKKPLFCCAFAPGISVSSALINLEHTTIYEPYYYQQPQPR